MRYSRQAEWERPMIPNFRSLLPRVLQRLPRRAIKPGRVVGDWRYARKVPSESGLSTLRILGEQALLKRFHSVSRYSYSLYRLFDPGVSWEEKKKYLVDEEDDYAPAKVRLWSLLAPEKYRALYDNKLVFNRFFSSLGFPLAQIY